MCHASDYTVAAVLGQSMYKKHYAISYACKPLTRAQPNYATMEKELLAVVFSIKTSHQIWWPPRLLSRKFMPLSSIF
jgi:hypothetical protein